MAYEARVARDSCSRSDPFGRSAAGSARLPGTETARAFDDAAPACDVSRFGSPVRTHAALAQLPLNGTSTDILCTA